MLGSEFEAALRQKMINREGQHKVPCPSCQHTRTKNKSDKPLSVNIDHEKIIYHCHHCEAEGLIPFEKSRPVKKTNGNGKAPTPPLTIKQDFSLKSEQWLNARGISVETAESCGCLIIDKNNKPVIGFAYPQDDSDKYEAVKWRSANGSKNFWWENSANKLWGRQVYNDSLETIEDTIVITEGEMDMLAIKESFKDHSNIDVYSVPNGAPNKITDKKIDPSEDGRFRYIWEERERFNVKRIILATDADIAGDALADELSRRLNKAKCYRVDYKGHKDANDLLINADAETVRNQVLGATPIPLHGLNSIEHYADEFQSLYDQGKPKGVSTGIKSVDKLFTLATGNLVVVTGYPGDGKSAWLNDIVISVGKNYGWKTCFCSFETPPSLHSVQLSQCLIGKPFFSGDNPRMTQEEVGFAQDWIKDHILFQDYQDGGLPTIEAILEKGSAAVMRYGVRILVIDPFNFIHSDYKGLETDMVSDLLTKVQLWCKQHDALCFFVAHPTKPQIRDGKKNVVTGVDVAKSMAFFSKCDTGITIYRGEDSVEVHCWKARWGWHSKLGKAELRFDPVTGRYEEAQAIEDNFDWEF
jgi:twinkle protein